MAAPSAEAKAILALVKKADAKAEALVNVQNTHRANTRFARNEITTSAEIDDSRVSLTVQLGLRSATANTNQKSPAALQALVERTVAMAKLSPELPEAMPVLGAQKLGAGLTLSEDALGTLDAASRAKGIAAALSHSKDELMTAGFLEIEHGTVNRVSSAGLDVSVAYTEAGFSVTSRTKDGTGSGWNSIHTRRKAELDFEKVGRIAAEKARASAKPKALEPGRYTVVLEPAAAATLCQYVVGSLDRRAVDEGRSCFVGKLGQRIANERITFTSDTKTNPMLPFDGEGTVLAPRTWVDKGVLKEFFVSRFWARKQNTTATGSYDGFEVLPGDATREQLLSGIKRGVLITRFWYSNFIDAKTLGVTALTRDGTFLIEDGVVTSPIKNFRINNSVLAALEKVDAVGNTIETPQSAVWRVPALRTHEFLLASTSDAV